MTHPIVFDIETQFMFQEVNYDHRKLKISVVGTYDYETREYKTYLENEMPQLFRKFEHAQMLIGFNSMKFDLPVLAPYYLGNIFQFPHLDLLEDVYKSLGFRIALDDLARGTLGLKKSGHGLEAIEFFRNNEWEKLKKYCLMDVEITKGIYEYGKKHGKLYYRNAGGKREIPVNFDKNSSDNSSVSLSLPF